MKTLAEIINRITEIETDTKNRGLSLSEAEISGYETELEELKKARQAFIEKSERQRKLLEAIADGKLGEPVTERRFGTGLNADSNEEKRSNDDMFSSVSYRTAFKDFVLRGTPISPEFRANEVTNTTDVGVIIPTTVLEKIVEKLESTGMILPLVTRTAYKGGLSVPTSSVKPVASWVAEGAGSDTQKKTIGNVNFTYHKLRCAVAVTLEVDTMSLAVFEQTLIQNVTEAMIKAIEQAIISGSGTGQPTGILTATPIPEQIITLSGGTVTYGEVVAAEGALPIEYEDGAVWCMSKKTWAETEGMTDSAGQPIIRTTMGTNGKLERVLLGRPVVLCPYLPPLSASTPSGTVVAFLYNFKDYILNVNYQMGIKRYEDNVTDDIVSKSVMLVDGKPVDINSLVVLKTA